MEIEIHLTNVENILDNLKAAEEKTGLNAIQFDLKRVVEAIKYLLETNSLNKETLN